MHKQVVLNNKLQIPKNSKLYSNQISFKENIQLTCTNSCHVRTQATKNLLRTKNTLHFFLAEVPSSIKLSLHPIITQLPNNSHLTAKHTKDYNIKTSEKIPLNHVNVNI